jgi:hypothetical protein
MNKLFIVILSIILHLLGVKSVDAVQSPCRTSLVSEKVCLAARSFVTILVTILLDPKCKMPDLPLVLRPSLQAHFLET